MISFLLVATCLFTSRAVDPKGASSWIEGSTAGPDRPSELGQPADAAAGSVPGHDTPNMQRGPIPTRRPRAGAATGVLHFFESTMRMNLPVEPRRRIFGLLAVVTDPILYSEELAQDDVPTLEEIHEWFEQWLYVDFTPSPDLEEEVQNLRYEIFSKISRSFLLAEDGFIPFIDRIQTEHDRLEVWNMVMIVLKEYFISILIEKFPFST